MALHLENLPRSLELTRDGEGRAELVLLDQRLLPGEVSYIRTRSWEVVVDAIKTLAVRGAPAIGVAGAAALALWADQASAYFAELGDFEGELARVSDRIANARPTAVNLSWAVARAVEVAQEALPGFDEHAGAKPVAGASLDASDAVADGCAGDDASSAGSQGSRGAKTSQKVVAAALFDLVKRMEVEDEATNRAIGANGAALVKPGSRVLTHCNAGSLACVFYGTALGVIYAAAAEGKIERVYSDETRPVGQGARLTSWELAQAGVPVTLICDNMAASLMAAGKVDLVVVGADRIARNGDTANKIGTYGVAVLAAHHEIPFYVAAPFSTIDANLADGSGIPIEQRSPREVLPDAVDGVDVWNPAFDVTPAFLITGIITERGVFAPADLAAALSE